MKIPVHQHARLFQGTFNQPLAYIAYQGLLTGCRRYSQQAFDKPLLKTAKLFERFASELNERQLRVLRRMLEEGPKGFQGGMSAKKYTSITKTSKATATRDLQDLANRGVLVALGGGRSTRYEIKLD